MRPIEELIKLEPTFDYDGFFTYKTHYIDSLYRDADEGITEDSEGNCPLDYYNEKLEPPFPKEKRRLFTFTPYQKGENVNYVLYIEWTYTDYNGTEWTNPITEKIVGWDYAE